MILTIQRTIKEALSNFWRNSWLTVASVSILTLSLYVAGIIYVEIISANDEIRYIEKRVNISAYFAEDTPENEIISAKENLLQLTEIQKIDYISRDQALENFKRDFADVPAVMQSLEEIGNNPLQASLVIKANEPTQYQQIADYINNSAFKEIVSRINYNEKNKEVIENLNKNIANLRRAGASMGIIFALITILIVFNTIRITIYTHKQEIEVMRLVGASNGFIQLPFIFEGIMYGLAAAAISMLMLALTFKFGVNYITPIISSGAPSSSFFGVFISKFSQLFGIELLLGIALGVISSMIAIRKYLKI